MHIQAEIERIAARLAAYPDPSEHAALYAAQQALCWAAQPEAYASPYRAITGNAEGSKGCSAESRQVASSGTGDEMSDVP